MNKNSKIALDLLLNILSVIFIIIGVHLIWPSVKTLYYVQTSHDWPSVMGKVLSSRVERRWASRDDDFGQSYFPHIWYGYRVDQRQYVSDGVFFLQPWTRFRASAEQRVAQYPVGSDVAVHYLVSDPQVSVLEKAVAPPIECFRFGAGVLLVLMGGVALMSTIFRGVAE